MKRLAVIPSDRIDDYLAQGMSPLWLREYYNPKNFFDEVYLLSELEKDQDECLGMKVIHTPSSELPAKIKELKIDVIRAYGGNWACAAACDHKVKGVPVVVSIHDVSPARLYDSIKKADVVWCVSQTLKDLALTKFKDPSRTWILPNRVHMDVMRPREAFEFEDLNRQYPFKYKILFAGRLVPEKNLDTLIKAIGILGQEYCALVIGRGDRQPYWELARGHRVDHRIFFIESVAHEELSLYYSLADCMCTPSRSEGFGLVFIEALACESVVVTSAIAPMTEYIKDEENGFLVTDYQGAHSLAQVIRRACEVKHLRERIKRNARQSVQRFENQEVSRLEAEYYQRVLEMRDQNKFSRSFIFSLGRWFQKKESHE